MATPGRIEELARETIARIAPEARIEDVRHVGDGVYVWFGKPQIDGEGNVFTSLLLDAESDDEIARIELESAITELMHRSLLPRDVPVIKVGETCWRCGHPISAVRRKELVVECTGDDITVTHAFPKRYAVKGGPMGYMVRDRE